MNLIETTVEGTLQPDGTLVLDAKPNLSPGRVTVVLRQVALITPPPDEDWFQFLLAARKRTEDAGCHFMDDEELKTHLDWLREGDQIDDLLREARKPEQP